MFPSCRFVHFVCHARQYDFYLFLDIFSQLFIHHICYSVDPLLCIVLFIGLLCLFRCHLCHSVDLLLCMALFIGHMCHSVDLLLCMVLLIGHMCHSVDLLLCMVLFISHLLTSSQKLPSQTLQNLVCSTCREGDINSFIL